MSETLYLKYRPTKLSDVLGQGTAVKALQSLVTKKGAHAFLLTGPSGTGKTTMARIASQMLGCETSNPRSLLQIDAATNTGIDDMRAVQELAGMSAWSEVRAVIIDEAHGLSRQAWDSMLKIIEEPPPNLYWFLLTTNSAKVPPTIKTRCAHIALKELKDSDLELLIENVTEAEGIELREDVVDMIITRANGSARQALVNLSLCLDCKGKKDAAQVLQMALATEPVLELARFVATGNGSWSKAMGLLEAVNGESPEGVRIQIFNYLNKAARGAKTDEQAIRVLHKLYAFDKEYSTASGDAMLTVSIGRALFHD